MLSNVVDVLQKIKNILNNKSLSNVKEVEHYIEQIVREFSHQKNTRLCVQQLFETETIKLCAIKWKIKRFQQEKLEELKARQQDVQRMNEGEINSKRDIQQKFINMLNELKEKSQKTTEKMNKLRNEEARLTRENEDRIKELNRCLETKAQRQTSLNTLREQAYEATNKCGELLIELEKINDELSQERITKRRHIVQLQMEIENLKKQRKKQENKNKELKRPYNEARNTCDQETKQLQLISNKLLLQRKTMHDLQHQQEQLASQLKKLNMTKTQATDQKEDIESQLQQMQMTHQKCVQDLKGKITMLEDRENDAITNIAALKEKLSWLLQASQTTEAEEEKMIKQVRRGRKNAKEIDHQLVKQITSIGELEEDMEQKRQEIEAINDSSKNLIITYKAQLEKMQMQLATEQKERVEAQRRKRKCNRDVENFKQTQLRFLRKTRYTIQKTESKKSNLQLEIKNFREQTKKHHEYFHEMTEKIEKLKTHILKERAQMETNVQGAKDKLQNVDNEINLLDAEIKTDTPKYVALQKVVKKRSEFYDRLLEKQTHLSLTQKSIAPVVSRLTKSNHKLTSSLAEAESRFLVKCTEHMTRLEADANELHEKEQEIYVAGCRYKRACLENARLKFAILMQEEALKWICSDWEKVIRNMSKNRNSVSKLTESLAHYQAKEDALREETIASWSNNANGFISMQCLAIPLTTSLTETIKSLMDSIVNCEWC